MDTGLLILVGIGVYAYLKSKKTPKDPREERLDAFFAELEAKGMTLDEWVEKQNSLSELKDEFKELLKEQGIEVKTPQKPRV